MPSLQKLHHRIVLAKLSTIKYENKLAPFLLWTAELQEVQLTGVTQVAQEVQRPPVEAKGTAERDSVPRSISLRLSTSSCCTTVLTEQVLIHIDK